METEIKGQSPTAPQTTQPASQAKSGDTFVLPEKFAGKSAEDIAKAYTELEKTHGQASARLGDYDKYSKLGKPEDVAQVMQWANQQYNLLKAGKVKYLTDDQGTPKDAVAPQAPNQVAPWESDTWEYLPEKDKARHISSWNQAQLNGDFRKYVDEAAAKYGEEAQQYVANQNRQMQLLIRVMDAALKSAGAKVSIEQLLTQAAGNYQRNPEDLISELAQPRLSPEEQQAEIQRQAETLAAKLVQDRRNEELNLGPTRSSHRPRLGVVPKTRLDEDRAIVQKWADLGIRR
jgi:hypothetical protein